MMVMGGLGGIIFALAPLPLVESIVRGNDILDGEILPTGARRARKAMVLLPSHDAILPFTRGWFLLWVCGWQRIRRVRKFHVLRDPYQMEGGGGLVLSILTRLVRHRSFMGAPRRLSVHILVPPHGLAGNGIVH